MDHNFVKSFPDDLLLALLSEHCQQSSIQINGKPVFLESELSSSHQVHESPRQNATPRNGFAKFSWLLKDWRVAEVIPTAPDFGFVAVLYVNEKRRQMVLAQSGLGLAATESASRLTPNGLSEESAFWALVRAVLSGSTAALETLALPHWRKALDETARRRDFSLTLTGHGLGGWFAEVGLWRLAREAREGGEAIGDLKLVAFDSPGANPMGTRDLKHGPQTSATQEKNAEANIKDMHNATQELVESVDFVKYVTLPNYVNTLSKQYAPRVYTMRHERFQTLSWPPNVPFLQVLLNLHSVTGLIQLLAECNNESRADRSSTDGGRSAFADSFEAVQNWPSMSRFGTAYMDRLLADVSQWRSFDALLSRRDAPLDCNSWEKSDLIYRISFHQTRGHSLRVIPVDTCEPLSFTRFVQPSAAEFPLITSVPVSAQSMGNRTEMPSPRNARTQRDASVPIASRNTSSRSVNLMRLALIDMKSLLDAMDSSVSAGLRASLMDLKLQVRAKIAGDRMTVHLTSKELPLEALEDRLADLLTLYPHLRHAVGGEEVQPDSEKRENESAGNTDAPKGSQAGGPESPRNTEPAEEQSNSEQKVTAPSEKKSSSCSIL